MWAPDPMQESHATQPRRRDGPQVKVVRVYHAGRDVSHRERDQALVAAGVDLTLVVPRSWPGPDEISDESFEIVEVDVRRPGDVNRHALVDPDSLVATIRALKPDLIDLHEEPFSLVTRQLLRRLPAELPVIAYTAQNIDKRFPPPFAQWEVSALARLDGLYPCSNQAASVAVGKGFRGPVQVLPLGVSTAFTPGEQDLSVGPMRILLVGRLVPEKGVLDAVHAVASLSHPVELVFVGEGPELESARSLATRRGVDARFLPWQSADGLAEEYRAAHVLLAPSKATTTWTEQFGRMVAEAQACGAVPEGYSSGSLPEVVGGAGVLVPEGDVDALALALDALLEDSDRWVMLRSAGLAVAEQRRWPAVAAGQIQLYTEAVRWRASRPRLQPRARAQRSFAQEQYGPPAGSRRPFALPVLREDTVASRGLAKLIDAGAKYRTDR